MRHPDLAPNETEDTMTIIQAFMAPYRRRNCHVGAVTHFVPEFLDELRQHGLVVAPIGAPVDLSERELNFILAKTMEGRLTPGTRHMTATLHRKLDAALESLKND